MFSKKVLIISIIIITLVIGIVAVIFTLQKNANQDQFSIGGRRPPASSNYQQFRDELGEAYTVRYPTEWEASQSPVAGGGTNATFAIPSKNEGEPDAFVNIQGVSVDDAPIGQVEGSFEAFGYTSENGLVQGIPAVRFAGSMRKLHEVAYVFEKDNTVYTMKLSYVSDAANPELEEQFEQVANTFSFN